MAQRALALNYCCYALADISSLVLCPSLSKLAPSLAFTYRRLDVLKSTAQPMEWKYIASLLRFVDTLQTPDLHPSRRSSLRLIAWSGPRTREARDLKLGDIFLVREGSAPEHIRVNSRGARTGTTKRPVQDPTVPKSTRSSDHCLVFGY